MRHQQDRLPAPAELSELVEALVREAFVADREHLVDEQHVGIDVDCHRESEAHVHPGRIGLHRRIDELAQLGEVDDLVEAILDLALGQAEHDAVDEDVLAPGNLRVEAGSQLDERRYPSLDLHRAARRLRDARDELQRRALARSVAPDDAVGGTLRHVEGHIGERGERFIRRQIAKDAPLQQRALERGELFAAVAPVDFRHVDQLDRGRHTASANESRSRSKSQ